MKIRIKIKHLVLSLVSIVLFLPLFFYVIQPQYILYVGQKQMENGSVEGKEKILQTINGKVLESQKWRIIERYMIEDTYTKRHDVYVGPLSTQPTDLNQNKFTLQERLPYLLEYVKEAPVNGYLGKAVLELSYYYYSKDDWEEANTIILKAMERRPDNRLFMIEQELYLEQIWLAILNKEYSLAEQYMKNVEQLLNNSEIDYVHVKIDLAKLELESHLKQKEYEKAYEKAVESIEFVQEEWGLQKLDLASVGEYELQELNRLLDIQKSLEKALTVEENILGGVKGRVIRNDGTPVQNVAVFLRAEDRVYRIMEANEPHQTVTNHNGEFNFTEIMPGDYQVFLGFSLEQIDGYAWSVDIDEWLEVGHGATVQYDVLLNPLIEVVEPVNAAVLNEPTIGFDWEAVEGAEYYSLFLGIIENGVSVGVKDKIKENHTEIAVNDLYAQTVSILFNDERDFTNYNASSVLGFANPKMRYSWYIQAYDSEGKKISQSNGYRLGNDTIGNLPFFYLQERELTKADQILLDKKPKKALQAYKEAFQQNPTDIHSLRMISRLIGMEAAEPTMRSYGELAASYWIKLANIEPNEETLTNLVEYYFLKRDWATYAEWYGKYKGVSKEEFNNYVESIHATALMKQGKYEDAREHFQKVMRVDRTHRFIGNWIAVEIMLNESLEEALAIAEKYPERTYYSEKRKWDERVLALEEEAKLHEGYMEELIQVLKLYCMDDRGQLDQWMEQTDKLEMKRFMKNLLEVS